MPLHALNGSKKYPTNSRHLPILAPYMPHMVQKKSLILFLIFSLSAFGTQAQTLKQATEKFYVRGRYLSDETRKFYNSRGQLQEEVTLGGRIHPRPYTVTRYTYNGSGLRATETLMACNPQMGSDKTMHSDTGTISVTHFTYDSLNRVRFEKQYGFRCGFDTCDTREYFYEGKRLVRKFFDNPCSSGSPEAGTSRYSIRYTYDELDSLIGEEARAPEDTARIWYINRWAYGAASGITTAERYETADDSLKLTARHVTRSHYLPDGRLWKTESLGDGAGYTEYRYDKAGRQTSLIYYENGRPELKIVSAYRKGRLIRRDTFFRYDAPKSTRLKLFTRKTFRYTYH